MPEIPNQADTDGDGLNDSEEVTLGHDGYTTNPWMPDTDLDGVADGLESNGWAWSGSTIVSNPNGFKTDPTRADTDRDGVADNRDRVPLGDLFVEVSIDSVTAVGSDAHNADHIARPFVEASLLGNDTYTPWLLGSGSWITLDPYYPADSWYDGHRLAVNVPDDTTTVDVTLRAWSYDTSGHNAHNPISVGTDTSFGGCSERYTVDKTYEIGPPGTNRTYSLSGGCPGTPAIYASPLSVTLKTVVPDRVSTYLIVPGDYSGIYNVTDAAGNVLSRRYVGEPRFVALVLNVSLYDTHRGCYCGPGIPTTILVPRSVFFDTRLYHYLNASNPIAPLDKLAYRQNDTSAASNADDLQEILVGNVTFPDVTAILDLLRLNATGAWVRQELVLGNDLLLYSLPDGAVRLSAYLPRPTAPSIDYVFCTSGCFPPPKPWWELIWTGRVPLVVGFLASGMVLAVTAFRVMGEVLSQVGNWLADRIVNAPARIASAVQAAAKVLGQVVDWIVGMAVSAITNGISGLVNGIKSLMDGTLGQFVRELEAALSTVDTDELANKLALLAEIVLGLAVAIAMIPVAIRVASSALKAMTAGVSWLVETAISEGVAEFIVRVLMGVAFSLAATALFSAILETMGWVEDTTVGFFRAVGVVASAIAAVSKVAFKLYESVFVKTAGDIPVVQRYKGFALALLGLSLVLIGSTAYAQSGLGRLVADFAGLAFQAYGFWLFMKNRNDPLVQIADFTAPIGSAIEYGVTVRSPAVGAAKISLMAAQGGYN